jgi:glycerol-3-phosphate dehydrogenase (NAD(P)+)
MAIITILGAGMMGSALALPLHDKGHEVRLVGTPLDEQIIDGLLSTGVHPKLKLAMPTGVRAFPVARLDEALDGVEVVGLGVSSAGVRWAAAELGPRLREGVPILSIAKGLELIGGRLVTLPDLLASLLPASLRAAPVAVAGPCIAGELARRVETCVVFTGRDPEITRRLAGLARGPYYHVFCRDDVAGVEACAALKNAYAMGVGFAAGLHEQRGGVSGSVAMHNHESAVFAQAVREMGRIVALLGGDPLQAMGPAGAGDLHVTCNGGRTGRFGRLLGLGIGLDEAIRRMEGATLECLEILAVLARALPFYEARGEIKRAELPLLWHLMEVAREGRPVAVPFDRFFGEEA